MELKNKNIKFADYKDVCFVNNKKHIVKIAKPSPKLNNALLKLDETINKLNK